MHYKEEARAKLLNETHETLFSARHKLGWVNFHTPDVERLKLVREELGQAIENLTVVINGMPPPEMLP
jgi:hypothetical protein